MHFLEVFTFLVFIPIKKDAKRNFVVQFYVQLSTSFFDYMMTRAAEINNRLVVKKSN